MNTASTLRLLAVLICSTCMLAAKPIPGPKGGRIVTSSAPHVEFYVTPDRAIVVSFYDGELRPIPASTQSVAATAELPSGKVKLEFAPHDGALVSRSALPAGDDYTVVLQVRDAAGAKPTNYRIRYHAETCSDCKRAEYARICDSAGEEGHNH